MTRLFEGFNNTGSQIIQVCVHDNKAFKRIRKIRLPATDKCTIKHVYSAWRKWESINDVEVMTSRLNVATGEQRLLDTAIVMLEGSRLKEKSIPDQFYLPK
jgi:hypothetical protein